MKPSKPFPFQQSKKYLRPSQLRDVYRSMRKQLGFQDWWPGDTPFEVMVGAILTQNTAWTHVEKAIRRLKQAKQLSPHAMRRLPAEKLADLIRPAGYFNVKAKRLKHFVDYFIRRYQGQVSRMQRRDGHVLRRELLDVNGIGPETADSILLYALEKPFFVIDAYTKRIFSRHRLQANPDSAKPSRRKAVSQNFDYSEWQSSFMEALPRQVRLFNDYHAQIVEVGKRFCRSRVAHCEQCPLNKYI